MANDLRVGDWVAWKWAAGMAEGRLLSINPERTVISSKGKKIVRNGTSENPALVIGHTSGTKVLKLRSEIVTEI